MIKLPGVYGFVPEKVYLCRLVNLTAIVLYYHILNKKSTKYRLMKFNVSSKTLYTFVSAVSKVEECVDYPQ